MISKTFKENLAFIALILLGLTYFIALPFTKMIWLVPVLALIALRWFKLFKNPVMKFISSHIYIFYFGIVTAAVGIFVQDPLFWILIVPTATVAVIGDTETVS